MMFQVLEGDCLEVLKTMPDCSVDAIVTDPPAGIAFMGKDWDKDKGGRDHWIKWMSEVAAECYRIIKPGGHALVWALPRTSHWTGMAWENGGWQPRDKFVHLFGSGFPKSLDIGKAIDKLHGAERDVVGSVFRGEKAGTSAGIMGKAVPRIDTITKPATPDAEKWDGFGTALKPAHEDWWLFRKPLAEKTVAENVLKHGTGGLNIGACRIGTDDHLQRPERRGVGVSGGWAGYSQKPGFYGTPQGQGRWPANVVLSCSCDGADHSESCPVSQFPEAGGMSASRFFQIFDMVDDNDFFMYNSEVNVAINILCGNITENQKIVSMFTGAIKAVERFIVVVEPFISGSNITESCQKDIVSTIETVTQWMTELKTLNVLPLKSTISFMRESEKTIKWLMEQNTDAVNSANNISHLIAFKQEALELIRDTAKSVLESHCKIGEAKTGKSTTHICENTVGVSRLKYTAKASKRDRDEGLENLPKTVTDDGRNKSIDNPYQRGETLRHNPHPTVKATPLMRWLCRLISPPGAVILDPFCGSGSTGKAAVLERFEFIGIEQDTESVQVARARIAWAAREPAPTLPPSAENDEQETAVTAPERPKQLSLFGV